jgi:heme A synthase
MEKSYRNLSYLFLALLLITIIGFFKTYFGLAPYFEGLKSVYHIHAVALLLWIAMLITQPLLIKNKRLDLHRKVGKLSYFVMLFVVYSIIQVAEVQYYRGVSEGMSSADLNFGMYMTFADVMPFTILYLLAIWYSKKPKIHMRLIIACSVIFFNPAIGRIFIFYLGVPMFEGILLAYAFCDLILLGFLFFDWKSGRDFKPYLYSLLFLVFWHTSFLYFPSTQLWQSIAQWLVKVCF